MFYLLDSLCSSNFGERWAAVSRDATLRFGNGLELSPGHIISFDGVAVDEDSHRLVT